MIEKCIVQMKIIILSCAVLMITAGTAEARVDCQGLLNFAMSQLGRTVWQKDAEVRWVGGCLSGKTTQPCNAFAGDVWLKDKTFCERFVRISYFVGGNGTAQKVNSADISYYDGDQHMDQYGDGHRSACTHAKNVQSKGDLRKDWENIRPGDLVFWWDESRNCSEPGHIGIYIGDYQGKKDQFISATGWFSPARVAIHSVFESSTQSTLAGYQSMGCDGVLPSNGGTCENITTYLDNWWTKEALPAMKDMTAQVHAYRIEQTKMQGDMMDAQNINRTARLEQEQRLEAQREAVANETTCVAGSYTTALTQTARTADALTQGLKRDLELYVDPLREQARKWSEYCTEFNDPTANAGMNSCPDRNTPGAIVNGDISIEGFLLKDTINLGNEHEYKAALALLRNLVGQRLKQRVADNVVNTVAGRDYILRQQHLLALSNISRDVVASIIARRAASDPATAGTVGSMIRQLRTKVGIDPALISDMPSYNEIMLALTKERFFDPEYFSRMQSDIAAIKKEQAQLDAYTAVQMQDIYRLQEQLNALLAARATLKLDQTNSDNLSKGAPIK